jgi:hypothetical protein
MERYISLSYMLEQVHETFIGIFVHATVAAVRLDAFCRIGKERCRLFD